jgi:hypothetical protein
MQRPGSPIFEKTQRYVTFPAGDRKPGVTRYAPKSLHTHDLTLEHYGYKFVIFVV